MKFICESCTREFESPERKRKYFSKGAKITKYKFERCPKCGHANPYDVLDKYIDKDGNKLS